eukprot:3585062-Ditylum_brightwellii.AAC.1
MLKIENAQEFNLLVSPTSKQSIYKFKTYLFSNKTAKDVLEWGKRLAVVIKYKPIETAKSKFDLVEVILKGNTLTHWQEFKRVKIVQIPKNSDRTDGVAPGISMDTYK